jgi:pimeloyl-ACP methyl ester carboxylesterase
MAAALALAVQELKDRLDQGTLSDQIPATSDATFIGIGHSMGGHIAVIQQGAHGSYDAVCLLGASNHRKEGATDARYGGTGDGSQLEWATKTARSFFTDTWDDVYAMIDRQGQYSWFYWNDVPKEIIAKDDQLAVAWPRMACVDAWIDGFTLPYAERIDVPVFLGYGEMDLTTTPHSESADYVCSRDVTTYVLNGSGHCHNFARTREDLWARIDSWLVGIGERHYTFPVDQAHRPSG